MKEARQAGAWRQAKRIRPLLLAWVAAAVAPCAANAGSRAERPAPSEVVPLWPGDAPGLVAVGGPEAFADGRYSHVSVPQLLVYLPPKEKANGTALIICAGGGYSFLAMGMHVENVVRLFNEQGVAVFGLKYRTRYGANDPAADALADGQRAVRLVRSRAAQWNLRPDRVGIQGYSAGANLCLNLLCHFDNGDATAADPVERFSSRPDFCVLMCVWPNGKTPEAFQPMPQAPPTWMAHARDDAVAPLDFARAVEAKLKALGVVHEFFLVENGGHAAFHYGVSPGPGGQWPGPFFAWLNKIGMIRTASPTDGPPALGAPSKRNSHATPTVETGGPQKRVGTPDLDGPGAGAR